MSFVIDCSGFVDAIAHPEEYPLPMSDFYAPELIDIEYAQALRRFVTHKQLSEAVAREHIDAWPHVNITRCPHRLVFHRVWELRHNFSAYDASYVALAEYLELPLITTDRRLARAAEQYCEVMALGD